MNKWSIVERLCSDLDRKEPRYKLPTLLTKNKVFKNEIHNITWDKIFTFKTFTVVCILKKNRPKSNQVFESVNHYSRSKLYWLRCCVKLLTVMCDVRCVMSRTSPRQHQLHVRYTNQQKAEKWTVAPDMWHCSTIISKSIDRNNYIWLVHTRTGQENNEFWPAIYCLLLSNGTWLDGRWATYEQIKVDLKPKGLSDLQNTRLDWSSNKKWSIIKTKT